MLYIYDEYGDDHVFEIYVSKMITKYEISAINIFDKLIFKYTNYVSSRIIISTHGRIALRSSKTFLTNHFIKIFKKKS